MGWVQAWHKGTHAEIVAGYQRLPPLQPVSSLWEMGLQSKEDPLALIQTLHLGRAVGAHQGGRLVLPALRVVR